MHTSRTYISGSKYGSEEGYIVVFDLKSRKTTAGREAAARRSHRVNVDNNACRRHKRYGSKGKYIKGYRPRTSCRLQVTRIKAVQGRVSGP